MLHGGKIHYYTTGALISDFYRPSTPEIMELWSRESSASLSDIKHYQEGYRNSVNPSVYLTYLLAKRSSPLNRAHIRDFQYETEKNDVIHFTSKHKKFFKRQPFFGEGNLQLDENGRIAKLEIINAELRIGKSTNAPRTLLTPYLFSVSFSYLESGECFLKEITLDVSWCSQPEAGPKYYAIEPNPFPNPFGKNIETHAKMEFSIPYIGEYDIDGIRTKTDGIMAYYAESPDVDFWRDKLGAEYEKILSDLGIGEEELIESSSRISEENREMYEEDFRIDCTSRMKEIESTFSKIFGKQ